MGKNEEMLKGRLYCRRSDSKKLLSFSEQKPTSMLLLAEK
jgi:hypothetical protein